MRGLCSGRLEDDRRGKTTVLDARSHGCQVVSPALQGDTLAAKPVDIPVATEKSAVNGDIPGLVKEGAGQSAIDRPVVPGESDGVIVTRFCHFLRKRQISEKRHVRTVDARVDQKHAIRGPVDRAGIIHPDRTVDVAQKSSGV